MLTIERIQYITGLAEYEGLSMLEISKRTGHHWSTIKKYLNQEDWNAEIKPRKQKSSKLDSLKPTIDKWLEEDQKMPRKQRHTGTRVYERLKSEPEFAGQLMVGKQTVINYVTKRKKEMGKSIYDTAILGYHPYGEAQLDFGEVYAYGLDGKMRKYYELIMSFPFSNGGYVQICKSQNTEHLLEAMQRIFEYMGKVPVRILFDNMSSAVVKILPKRERKLTDTFSRFALHHRFKPDFCNPNSGQEKGSVENKVGYKRRNFFVPVPTILDLNEFNVDLLKKCDEDMDRAHYRKKEKISELLKKEREAMLPLPKQRFKVSRLEKVKTDKYSFVSFENNKYSTAPEYNRCEMWIEVSAEEIRVLNDKYEEVVVHKRCYDQNPEPIVDWMKYLTAINRKPNAFKYTSFFKDLPVVWQEYFRHADYDDQKKMLNILTPILLDGNLEEATIAMEVHDIRDADDFLLIYRNLTEPPKPALVHTANTPKQIPYQNDLSVYGCLMGGDE